MSYQLISSRLDTLQENIQNVSALIQRLHKLQPETSGADAASNEALSPESLRLELATDIHESLKQYEDDLEMAQQDVDDLAPRSSAPRRPAVSRSESERERQHASLHLACERAHEDLVAARSRFRRAQLQAKTNAEQAARADKAAYLSSLQAAAAAASAQAAKSEDQQDTQPSTDNSPHPDNTMSHAAAQTALFAGRRGPRRDPNATQSDLVLTAQSDITSGLKRNHALMSAELSRARFAQETLDESNKALEELSDRYTSFNDLLAKSRGLLGTLLRSQKSDTWYLETAVWLLIATVSWLLFRRLLYGPLWWLLWMPLKFAYSWCAFVFGGFYGIARSNAASSTTTLATREPLKVMPSASGRPPRFNGNQQAQQAYIPAGAGGAGAKFQHTGNRSPQGSLSEAVGSMVEEASAFGITFSEPATAQATQPSSDEQANAQQQQQQGQERDADAGRAPDEESAARAQRADGQPLRERDPRREPPNPKKRMMEVPVEEVSQQRDEL